MELVKKSIKNCVPFSVIRRVPGTNGENGESISNLQMNNLLDLHE